VAAVAAGGIIAMKGIGGCQLVCDAGNAAVVAELRRRKRRPAKPFAVMVRDLAAVERLARTTRAERGVLTSPSRPVVLLTARAGQLCPDVHAGTDRIGVFLPTTVTHDRPIRARYDDSVATVADRTVLTIRRARGLAPAPLPLPVPASLPLVAAGAQLKHPFTLAEGGRAHLGRMAAVAAARLAKAKG
jgi:hydrogenase maturation protein HypF